MRDTTGTLLSDVCKDVELVPSLLLSIGEEQTMRKTAQTNDEVRLAICARSFWVIGQKAFFNVWVFDPNARRYSKQTLKQCYFLNRNEKKFHCNTTIIGVDQGNFTLLVFTVAGAVGSKGIASHSRLATLLSLEKGSVTNLK